MKKLMIALAVVAMAAVSQAASIVWSCNGIVDKLGVDQDKSAQFSTYKAIATFYDASGNFLFESEGIYDDVMFGSFDGQWKGTDIPAPAQNTGYMAQLVLTDKDGYTLTSEKAEFTTSGSNTYTIDFGTGDNFKVKAGKFDQAGANYGWQSVPEPTSGLLLLLGMAGLALKRKRA